MTRQKRIFFSSELSWDNRFILILTSLSHSLKKYPGILKTTTDYYRLVKLSHYLYLLYHFGLSDSTQAVQVSEGNIMKGNKRPLLLSSSSPLKRVTIKDFIWCSHAIPPFKQCPLRANKCKYLFCLPVIQQHVYIYKYKQKHNQT